MNEEKRAETRKWLIRSQHDIGSATGRWRATNLTWLQQRTRDSLALMAIRLARWRIQAALALEGGRYLHGVSPMTSVLEGLSWL
jgi:hypothetical protein